MRISRRNQNQIRKYFSLWIKSQDGLKTWKNEGQTYSPFKGRKHAVLIKISAYLCTLLIGHSKSSFSSFYFFFSKLIGWICFSPYMDTFVGTGRHQDNFVLNLNEKLIYKLKMKLSVKQYFNSHLCQSLAFFHIILKKNASSRYVLNSVADPLSWDIIC